MSNNCNSENRCGSRQGSCSECGRTGERERFTEREAFAEGAFFNEGERNANQEFLRESGELSERRNCREQHVHEVLGSTIVSGRCGNNHSHRFATVSGEALPCGRSHVHRVTFRTDSINDHFHEFSDVTGPAVWVGGGRHVHFASAETTSRDGHTHCFRVASLIDDPTECE